MKNYFKSNIQYYLRHLQESGCPDPVQVVVTDFVSYMKEHINDKQKKYIDKEIDNKNKRIIEDSLVLLGTIKTKDSDTKTLKLIEEGLKSLL